MIPVVQEVTCRDHGLGMGSMDDDPVFGQEMEFGQEAQVQYNALELFDYGNVRPLLPSLSPSPRSPPQPRFLCNILLRMMSLVAAMHPWELCIHVRGDSWGGERSSLLLVVMLLLLLLVVDVVVVLNVLVFVILQNMQIIKDGGGTGHETFGCCSKAIQLGQVTLSMWR